MQCVLDRYTHDSQSLSVGLVSHCLPDANALHKMNDTQIQTSSHAHLLSSVGVIWGRVRDRTGALGNWIFQILLTLVAA